MPGTFGALDPAQVVAQLALALRVADRRLLQRLLRLLGALQALRELLLRGRRSTQFRCQCGIGLRRFELEIVGLLLAACQHRLQGLFAAALGTGIINRHCQHGEESLRCGFQLPTLQGALGLAQALVDGLCQCFLAGGQIGVAGIELARTLQYRGCLGQLAAPGQDAGLLQQIAQCVLATFQRRQIVRLQYQDALEQGQRAAVTVVQPARCKGVARLRQQCTDAGACAAPGLQLACHGVRIALRHLQFPGQCQRLRAAFEVVGLQFFAGLLQGRGAGTGQPLTGLRTITIQRQHGLVALTRTTAIGGTQPPGRQCAIAFGQQLFNLRLIPEPVGQRLAQQHQQHEHRQRRDQRPAPHPARVTCLQPPPTAFAADAVQRRMFSAMRAMRRLAFHACRVAGAA